MPFNMELLILPFHACFVCLLNKSIIWEPFTYLKNPISKNYFYLPTYLPTLKILSWSTSSLQKLEQKWNVKDLVQGLMYSRVHRFVRSKLTFDLMSWLLKDQENLWLQNSNNPVAMENDVIGYHSNKKLNSSNSKDFCSIRKSMKNWQRKRSTFIWKCMYQDIHFFLLEQFYKNNEAQKRQKIRTI